MSAVRAASNEAAEQRKKIIAGAAFAVFAAGVLYYELADPSPKAAPPSAASVAPVATPGAPPRTNASAATSSSGSAAGSTARTVGTTSAALDPTLHMQAMLVTESVAYNGTGRNIFAAPGAVTDTPLPKIPKPVTPVRTNQPPPAAYVPPGPPPPPPIELKFFGTVTTNGHRQAFLLHGDDVSLAGDGDIVQRKYKVLTVGPRSVQVEDMTNSNKQTLPLAAGGTNQQ